MNSQADISIRPIQRTLADIDVWARKPSNVKYRMLSESHEESSLFLRYTAPRAQAVGFVKLALSDIAMYVDGCGALHQDAVY